MPITSVATCTGESRMDYYAGLDVSMEETHICVIERDGRVVLEAKTRSTPEALAAVLETAPAWPQCSSMASQLLACR
jgi:hypothetical protein